MQDETIANKLVDIATKHTKLAAEYGQATVDRKKEIVEKITKMIFDKRCLEGFVPTGEYENVYNPELIYIKKKKMKNLKMILLMF